LQMKEVIIRFVAYSENHISLRKSPEIRTGPLLKSINKPGPNQWLISFSDTNPT